MNGEQFKNFIQTYHPSYTNFESDDPTTTATDDPILKLKEEYFTTRIGKMLSISERYFD